jgi:hypothetical protein
MKDKKKLTAPCGLDCFNCELYEENITEQIKTLLSQKLNIDKDNIVCKGCRAQEGHIIVCPSCKTYECVKAQGVEFCFECQDFPCSKLQPAAEGAGRYPHNLKLYNLLRMKLIGFEKWTEEASDNRKRYFKGTFVVGLGPILEK